MRRALAVGIAAATAATLIACGGGEESRKAAPLPAVNGMEAVPEAGATVPFRGAVAWADNVYTEIGDGTVCNVQTGANCRRLTPVAVVAPGGSGQLGRTRSIVAGESHTLALQSDRTVLSWGWNGEGELGNGKVDLGSPVPAPVVGQGGKGVLGAVTALGGGSAQSLAVAQSGRVWAWGGNIWGQLGVGTSTGPQQCPTQASAPPGAPPRPSAQRPPDGTDQDNAACAQTPTPVVGPDGKGQLDRVAAVAGGSSHSVALRRDGTVWTWGLNGEGQLGIGTSSGPEQCKPFARIAAIGCSTKPVQVVGPEGKGNLTNVIAVAAGEEFTLALRSDKTVWAWGSDGFQSLGQTDPKKVEKCNTPFRPDVYCSTKPVQVVGPGGSGFLIDVVEVAAEGSNQALHGVARKSDGTVWAWGPDENGQLGNGKSKEYEDAPVQVVGPGGNGFLTGVAEVGVGSKFTVARKSDGTVWAWGYNLEGELGINDNTGPEKCTTQNYPCSLTPVQVKGVKGSGSLTGITGIAVGNAFIVAATGR